MNTKTKIIIGIIGYIMGFAFGLIVVCGHCQIRGDIDCPSGEFVVVDSVEHGVWQGNTWYPLYPINSEPIELVSQDDKDFVVKHLLELCKDYEKECLQDTIWLMENQWPMLPFEEEQNKYGERYFTGVPTFKGFIEFLKRKEKP